MEKINLQFVSLIPPDANDEQNLTNITDEIFEGGTLYVYELPQDELKVFRLYNPCNQYEMFLVQ